MFRRRNSEIEVLLAHPGGPFFIHKDDGVWTIPKGEAAPGEDLLTRAQIEFEEEVGFRPDNVQQWIELGWIQQKGGKIVHAWAFEGDLPEPFECKSNLFELEWPPRSGKFQEFPEVDRACFFSNKAARRKLKARQIPFLDRLCAALTDRNTDPTRAVSDDFIMGARALRRRTTHAVFDQTLVQPLAPRQHQSCQACDRDGRRCNRPADRDCPACFARPAFVVIPVGLAILATEYAWARRWLRKVRRIASDVVSGRKRTSVPIQSYRVIAASTRNTHPIAPKTKLTIQKRRFFVSAEIAAMAIAIWNIVTPRANTSCL
jgi:predicted NUDIX family NTP pyrophosphohydrolase